MTTDIICSLGTNNQIPLRLTKKTSFEISGKRKNYCEYCQRKSFDQLTNLGLPKNLNLESQHTRGLSRVFISGQNFGTFLYPYCIGIQTYERLEMTHLTKKASDPCISTTKENFIKLQHSSIALRTACTIPLRLNQKIFVEISVKRD